MPTSTPKSEVPANADDPAESQRFIDMAREMGVDESPGAFDRAFKKALPKPQTHGKRDKAGTAEP